MTKTYPKFFLSILFIFLAGLIHILARFFPLPIRTNSLTLALYSLVILFWMEKNKQVILHRQVRRYLTYVGYLLIVYLFIRTLKYEFVSKGSSLERYLWYVYYIVLMAIGVFLLFSVLYIDKARHEKIDRRWNLVYLLFFVFSALFFSNDLHQLIFTFPQGLENWSDSTNGYGPLFFLLVLYCGVIVLGTFFISTRKLLDRRNVKNIFITLSVPLVWGLYTYFYLIRAKIFALFFVAFKSPEVNCLVSLAYIESLIYNRLLPVNLDYEKFWAMSSLDIGMMDNKGVFYRRNNALSLNKDLVLRAEGSPVFLDQNTLLESAKVFNGYSYWLTDMTVINSIKGELESFGDLIAEENELLEAENKLKEDQASISKQLEICNYIEAALEDKFSVLDSCLNGLPDDEDGFYQGMRLPTLINVYIKRYSNMLLLGQKAKAGSLIELRLAMEESLGYLNLFDLDTNLFWQGQAELDFDKMLRVYRVFEDVLERNIKTMKAVFVLVKVQARELILSMEIENPDSRTFSGARVSDSYVDVDQFIEEGTLFVRARFSLGSDFYGN